MSEDTAAPRTETEPVIDTRTAHLAGVEHEPSGAATLWLSDEATTMHFPLTPATVPALITQLREVDAGYLIEQPPDEESPDLAAAGEPMHDLPEEPAGRLARWTGWHYSNSLVRRIPAQQRAVLFAAVLVILLLITMVTRR